ncbi:MAG: hypothetical protein M1444_00045, partial [Patescibacteria group bacterium]|nr:hypothetical protein [Patescibacteria group bacterium]
GGNQPSAGLMDLITQPIGLLLGVILGAIGGFLAFFIILIAILWSLFKLWFALLEAYIMILVGIIFAPFWIVTGLLPGGQSMGFGAWLREMLGNLVAFPVTIAMFIIGRILIDAFGSGYTAGQFNPPLLGNPAATDTFGPIIALGIIFTTPHIVKITKAAFKAPKIDLGPIGQAVGVGTGTVSGGAKQTAASLFVAVKGAYPKSTEEGGTAVLRRFLGKF